MSNRSFTLQAFARHRLLLAAAGVCCALTVTACSDGATATSDDTTNTSIAPLPREGAVTATTTTPGGSVNATATATTTPPGDSEVPPAARVSSPSNPGEDRGAREITAPPTTENLHSPADTNFLAALKGAGINTAGVEAQLIGAGHTVCTNPNPAQPSITLQAVAGQIVTQQRSTATPDAVAHAMTDAATKAYCPQPGH